jgi:hypothetical protein
MGFFGLNAPLKMLASLLVTLCFLMAVHLTAKAIFAPEFPAKPGFIIAPQSPPASAASPPAKQSSQQPKPYG